MRVRYILRLVLVTWLCVWLHGSSNLAPAHAQLGFPSPTPEVTISPVPPGPPSVNGTQPGIENDRDDLTQLWIGWLGGKITELYQDLLGWFWGWAQGISVWLGQLAEAFFEGLKALSWYAAMALIATVGQVACFLLDGLILALPTGPYITKTIDENPVLAALNWILPISEVLIWVQLVGGALLLWLLWSWLMRWLKVVR